MNLGRRGTSCIHFYTALIAMSLDLSRCPYMPYIEQYFWQPKQYVGCVVVESIAKCPLCIAMSALEIL